MWSQFSLIYQSGILVHNKMFEIDLLVPQGASFLARRKVTPNRFTAPIGVRLAGALKVQRQDGQGHLGEDGAFMTHRDPSNAREEQLK